MSTAVFTERLPVVSAPVVDALMFFAGLGWMTLLCPAFATFLEPYDMVLRFIGDASLTLWLLGMGVSHSQERNTQ